MPTGATVVNDTNTRDQAFFMKPGRYVKSCDSEQDAPARLISYEADAPSIALNMKL